MKYCEEFEALLDLYVDGELEVADMIRVQEHLDACSACQAYVDELLAIRAAFPEIEDTVVPEGFADSVMRAIAASAPKKTTKRATPWKKILVPMAACLAVVVMALPLSGLMNNARMESAAPAEAPAAAASLYTADMAETAVDTPAEMVMEAPAAAPAAEEAEDIYYQTTTNEPAEAEAVSATGTASRISDETGLLQDGAEPEAPAAAKQQGSVPRAVITLQPEGANLELLLGRAADRQTADRMEFDLPVSDYEMLLIQLDESGLEYLAEEYPAADGDTILVIIELEQVQQN
ncbi:MAG: zf-HC2 domain-containing protein [Clostridia bacterium]|nr:zf-HC2 domain-containing protein [Clostridia bacterium]